MKIDPGLDILAVTPALSFLRRLQLVASGIAPTAFGEKGIPDLHLLLARSPAPGKAPFEDFLVRPALQGPLRELVIIDPQKSGAARIESGWLIDSDKVIGWQLSRRMEPNLVQHAREINQPFGLAIVAAGSSHRGKLPGLVLMCQYPLGTNEGHAFDQSRTYQRA